MSLDAARLVYEARETVARFFGVSDASRIIFTSGATESINLGLFGLLQPGDHVVTTVMEHNSVLRPLRALQDRGVAVTRVGADKQGRVTADDLIAACTSQTRLVVLTHCSNVTGTVQPVEQIANWTRRHGILLMVDAAQSAGLLTIDAPAMGIDLLVVPGHKGLLGPTGIGCLYVREGIELQPLIYGGTGTQSESDRAPQQMPERLESGTPNTSGIAGLKAGIDWLQTTGLETVRHHERELLEVLVQGLKALPDVIVYGPDNLADHGGAVSFASQRHDPSQIGFLLDHEHDIMVRIGLHCAPEAHRAIGTWPQGTIRVSPGHFTTIDQIETFLHAVSGIVARR
jgi:cysteine desulfurase family protein